MRFTTSVRAQKRSNLPLDRRFGIADLLPYPRRYTSHRQFSAIHDGGGGGVYRICHRPRGSGHARLDVLIEGIRRTPYTGSFGCPSSCEAETILSLCRATAGTYPDDQEHEQREVRVPSEVPEMHPFAGAAAIALGARREVSASRCNKQ